MRKIRTNRPDFADEKAALTKKFGKPPSDADVMWSLLNKDRLKHSRENNWGLYRNDTLDMGDVLLSEGRAGVGPGSGLES